MRDLLVEDEPYMAEAIRDGLRLQATVVVSMLASLVGVAQCGDPIACENTRDPNLFLGGLASGTILVVAQYLIAFIRASSA